MNDASASSPSAPDAASSSAGKRRPTVSVVIPTYQRSAWLKKCVASLAGQVPLPDEVVVGVRRSDAETLEAIASLQHEPFPVRPGYCDGGGVIGGMQAALEQTTGEIVALLDDDVTLLLGWIDKVVAHFERDPRVGGVGGRDLLKDHEWRVREPLKTQVGIFTWYGRALGNHHRGTGGARAVHVLKGCNCAYRGDTLREIGFDRRLRGAGAQVGWELSLAFSLRQRGWILVYDSDIQVDHWIAPRHDQDSLHRGVFNRQGLEDVLYNEMLIFHTRAPFWERVSHALWLLAVGDYWGCGAVRALIYSLKGDKTAWTRFGCVARTWFSLLGEPRR